MSAFDVFGQVWVRLPNGEWQRNLIRECTCCNHLSVQPLQFVMDDSVFCLACLGTNMRMVQVNGQRMFRCQDCMSLTEFDAFLGVDAPEGEGYLDPKGTSFFMEEFEDDDDDQEDDDSWKRPR